MANRISQIRNSFKLQSLQPFDASNIDIAQPSPAFSMTPLRPMDQKSSSMSPVSAIPEEEEAGGYEFTKSDQIKTAKSLRGLRHLHYVRIVLSVILLAAGAAVVGSEAHAIHVYHSTQLPTEWFLPLWPSTLDVRPSVALLAVGAIVLLANAIYLVFALIPSFTRRYFLHNALYISFSLLGLVVTAFATGFAAHIYYHHSSATSRDTIESWTCRWQNGPDSSSSSGTAPSFATRQTSSAGLNGDGGLNLPAVGPPSGFGRVCKESHAGFDIMAIMLCLEVLGLVLGAVGVRLERRL